MHSNYGAFDGLGISNGILGWYNICIFTESFEMLGICTVSKLFRSGELHNNKKFRFMELHGQQTNDLMWLDGSEVNTLQKCKLERPMQIASLEQFGS